MATVDKNFRIKNGLVVEGSVATVNGENILTETGSDQYIINLIGGTATPDNTANAVVKRDENGNFAAGAVTVQSINVSGIGTISDDDELLIAASEGEDIRLTADDIRLNSQDDIQLSAIGDVRLTGANVYAGGTDPEHVVATQGTLDNALSNYTPTADLDTTVDGYGYLKSADLAGYATETYANDAAENARAAAVTSANEYTDGISGQLATSIQQAVTTANSYTDDEIAIEVTNRNNAITNAINAESDSRNNAISDAIATEVTDRNNAIANAKQEAIDYADDLINDGSNLSTEVWSAYKTNTEIGLAEQRAKDHADDAVAELVGSAPELLDTIQELATALENNPDIIADLENVAAGKQNTLTPGANIDITSDVISVTGLVASDISDFNSAALSATSAAYDAAGAAADAQTNAETTAQNALNEVLAGNTQFTEVAIDWMVTHVGSYAYATNLEHVAYEWNHNKGASAKFLVRMKNGIHSQVSEVLLTRDDSNNIAITEYGIVTTNGILGDITAGMNGNNIQLKVDPTHDTGTEIFVSGTLLRYAD